MKSHSKAVVAIATLLSTLVLGTGQAAAAPPTVTIDPSQSAAYTTAHVTGEIDPADNETYFYFEYAIDPGTEDWTAGPEPYSEGLAPGSGARAVDEDLTGLKPNTEYEVRLVAENFVDAPTYSAEPNPTFTTKPVDPPALTIDPVTEFTGTTAKFTGTVDPEAPLGDPDEFEVHWRFDCTPDCSSIENQVGTFPPSADLSPVERNAIGLEPNTEYEVVLIGRNLFNTQETSTAPRTFTTTTIAPEVQTLFAGSIETDAAILAAAVNPGNSPTTYQFEWGTDDDYGNITPAAPQAVVPVDNSFHVVTAPISGLEEGTEYHFRLVAENDQAQGSEGVDHSFRTREPLPPPTGTCPNADKRTGPSASLPDCRAYEMVSPVDKNGGDVEPGFIGSAQGANTAGAAPDGSSLAYASRTTFGAGAQAGSLFPTARSFRTASGWQTRAIAPPSENRNGQGLFTRLDYFSDDLTRSIVSTPVALTPESADLGGEEFSTWGLYLRDETGPLTYRLVSDPSFALSPDTSITRASSRFTVGAATPDLSLVAFNSNRQLLPEGPPDSQSITDAVYVWSAETGQLVLGSVYPATVGSKVYVGSAAQPMQFDVGQHALSRDGGRLYFSVGDGVGAEGGTIFVREDPMLPSAATREVASGAFLAARAEDGAIAIVNSPEDGLLRWDAEATPGDELTAITPPAAYGDVLGSPGISASADTVYFVSRDAIGTAAVAGRPNLYVWTEADGTRLVATLSEADTAVWSRTRHRAEAKEPNPRSARVTADGNRLLFTSRARLTSYDNDGSLQAYLYDLELDRMVCVSCESTSGDLEGDANLFSLDIGQFAIQRTLPRNLSADGERVFFESDQDLLPADVNDRGDVYMWTAGGEDLNGSLSLISTGKDSSPSLFMNASSSGDDVFLASREQLVAVDDDNHVDAYDARVGGGFAMPVLPDCAGEGCQEEPAGETPAAQRPGSPGFSGSANAKEKRKPKRCRNGKVKRKGKCVKKKQTKRPAGKNRGAGK